MSREKGRAAGAFLLHLRGIAIAVSAIGDQCHLTPACAESPLTRWMNPRCDMVGAVVSCRFGARRLWPAGEHGELTVGKQVHCRARSIQRSRASIR
jgi:hypothetical protein